MNLEEIKSIVQVLLLLFQAIAILAGAYTLIFIFIGFHPNMEVNLFTEWVDKERGILLIKMDIRNISKVKCLKESVFIQFLEYSSEFEDQLSEWVPFHKDKQRSNEMPLVWKEPVEVMTSTNFWYPNDSVKTDRYYKCSKGRIYKIGLQLRAKVTLMERISRLHTKSGFKKKFERWTTTKIVYSPAGQENPSLPLS